MFGRHTRGFTLIEGIIAVGIISTALIVGLALAYSNLTAAQENSDRIIAGQLAREGVEVMRNIRDSNWLRQDANADKDTVAPGLQFYAWDDFFDGWPTYDPSSCDPSGCGNYFDVIMKDTNFSNPAIKHNYTLRKVLESEVGVIRDVVTCLDNSQQYCRVKKDGGVYYQENSAGGSVEPYYRRIILKPICWDGTSGDESEYVEFDRMSPDMNCVDVNPLIEEKVGVLVTVQVIWQRGKKIQEVQVKERLYNWRSAL